MCIRDRGCTCLLRCSFIILGAQGDMFIVRRTRKQFFEKKYSKWDSNSCPAVDANCKRQALVRWATGKRSTNRLPKSSLITISCGWQSTLGRLENYWSLSCGHGLSCFMVIDHRRWRRRYDDDINNSSNNNNNRNNATTLSSDCTHTYKYILRSTIFN